MEIKNSLLRNLDPYRNKIDSKEAAASGGAGRSKGPAPGQTQGQASAAQGDRVSLSSSALLHTTAHAAASGAPDVRQEKVDALKERVASGEYTVDSRKVAEKLLESEALLAGTLGGGAE